MGREYKQVTVRLPLSVWRALEPKVRHGGSNAFIVRAVERELAEEAQAEALGALARVRARTRDANPGPDAAILVRNLREGRETLP